MTSQKITLRGEVEVPCDKSITHRAILFPCLAKGESRVRINSIGRDNIASIRVMRQLGVTIFGSVTPSIAALLKDEGVGDGFEVATSGESEIILIGEGLEKLTKPIAELDCGNSGTTARLICGILAGCHFPSVLTGDESLKSRPFLRVVEPLSNMGARFSSDVLPIEVRGGDLGGIAIKTKKASAQVKSAILLAGLNAFGDIHVSEPVQSRNHTELMLRSMGCPIEETAFDGGRWGVTMPQASKPEFLNPLEIEVPGDFSSASFLIVAALVVPGSEIMIRNVCFNPTRIGLYELLIRMGAAIEVQNSRTVGGEEVVDLLVRASELRAISVSAEEVVRAIDEIPILSVAAAFAEGETEITGAEELRVKESDRIAMICDLLSSHSIAVEERKDGLLIHGLSQGGAGAEGATTWKTSGDHRIAMSGAILQLALSGELNVVQESVIETSFPGFVNLLQGLSS